MESPVQNNHILIQKEGDIEDNTYGQSGLLKSRCSLLKAQNYLLDDAFPGQWTHFFFIFDYIPWLLFQSGSDLKVG